MLLTMTLCRPEIATSLSLLNAAPARAGTVIATTAFLPAAGAEATDTPVLAAAETGETGETGETDAVEVEEVEAAKAGARLWLASAE